MTTDLGLKKRKKMAELRIVKVKYTNSHVIIHIFDKKFISPSENRTPVSRVTGVCTSHYTKGDLLERESIFIYIKPKLNKRIHEIDFILC